jgi:hypothetical protein
MFEETDSVFNIEFVPTNISYKSFKFLLVITENLTGYKPA